MLQLDSMPCGWVLDALVGFYMLQLGSRCYSWVLDTTVGF